MNRSGEMTEQPNPDVRPQRATAGAVGEPKVMAQPIFDARDVNVSYGDKLAVRDVSLTMGKQRDHRADRPVGLRQVDVPALPEPDERPDPRRARVEGDDHLPRAGPLRQGRRPGPGAQARRHGLPEAEPVPEVDLRQHRLRPARDRDEGRHGRDRRERPAPRGAVGRGQGPPEDERLRHVGRPAAAPVHRPRAGDLARRPAHGRAVLGARPDLHGAHRGPDARAQGRSTRSSSSPTTCSRPRASRTGRRSSRSTWPTTATASARSSSST